MFLDSSASQPELLTYRILARGAYIVIDESRVLRARDLQSLNNQNVVESYFRGYL